nr:MAG TPA: hypothetical protein [Caudoviricetes sp.]DAK58774.1 MAG TPA: hypothetical protein [Caudoviricetes sp.]DAL68684.1 MAG TPA: hypothetical protein [Caudoviricetes sp.]DAV43071.1 MAG TPA: hypothetical protein [Caudoviricetes sp.]
MQIQNLSKKQLHKLSNLVIQHHFIILIFHD